ncbi:hypothetical protein F8M41_019193 [Gigaspora margarita]|uniref:Uncharacterized protein n=1 Tax=Gigaspora margarita TaxID=4874 RepID=A0A8H4B2B0_GIGMA|nr:hypothetical protein F8M41_019193 [Gigaspora margarita]
MSNEGVFLQAPKSEYEEKIEIEIIPIKPYNSRKITKLLLSPNSKYAVTWSKYDKSICGWQLDKYQPIQQSVEQSENESYQPKSFKFDCLIYVDELCKMFRELIAVSNNKLVAI